METLKSFFRNHSDVVLGAVGMLAMAHVIPNAAIPALQALLEALTGK